MGKGTTQVAPSNIVDVHTCHSTAASVPAGTIISMASTQGSNSTPMSPRSLSQHGFAGKHPRLMRGALILVWYLGVLLAFFGIGALVTIGDTLGSDAHAYWLAAQNELVYDKAPGHTDAYLYSPAFVTAITPLAMLPWPLFLGVWVCLEVIVLVWLLKPLSLRWSVPLLLCCAPELIVGNINIFLAGAAVMGMRAPAVWAFVVLTKLTPGIGMLWFAVRGDWQNLAQGIGGTAIIMAFSSALTPGEWMAWTQFILGHSGGTQDGNIGFVLRCLLAAVVVAIGAWKCQPWLIAPAMLLSSPILVNFPALALLTSIPRLMCHDASPETADTRGTSQNRA
jgi:hypothetical protein